MYTIIFSFSNELSSRNGLYLDLRHYQVRVLSEFTGDAGVGWNQGRIGINYDSCNFADYNPDTWNITTDIEIVNGRPSCPEFEEWSDCANECSDNACPVMVGTEIIYKYPFCATACKVRKCVCEEGLFRDPADNACKPFDDCPGLAVGNVWEGQDCFKNTANYTRLFALNAADDDHCSIKGPSSSEYDQKSGMCNHFNSTRKQSLIDASWGSYMRPLDAMYVLIANDTDQSDALFTSNLAKLGSMIDQILDSTNEWRGHDAAKVKYNMNEYL